MKLKFSKLFTIPLLLTFGYLLLLFIPFLFSKINSYDSLGLLSVIEESPIRVEKMPSPTAKTDRFDSHLLQGDTIAMHLTATENNFGIVLFRFAKLSGIVTDSVNFRIKEEGAVTWYYTHTYKANQFQQDQYFAFGFPAFATSKNHSYRVEITSLHGSYANGVGISQKIPDVAFVYKYSRSDLKHLPTLFSFIRKKLIYAIHNFNVFQHWEVTGIFLLLIIFAFLFDRVHISIRDVMQALSSSKNLRIAWKKCIKKIKLFYIPLRKKTIRWFTSIGFYTHLLNTDRKKRIIVFLILFSFAFMYRFSSSLTNIENLFYTGLGGGSDYDQFIRAAICAVKNFCPAILGQNFLFESSLLGIFYELFGFTGGLKVYLYLMMILNSILATLPYLILSRKNWKTTGGVIGSLFLIGSDFYIRMALSLPPDNGSLFLFSTFYIVYLFTMQWKTIRWLLFFGLMGTIDGLNKLTMLINDSAVFTLFILVFFYEKAQKMKRFPFLRFNFRLIFYSLLPMIIFLLIYSSWEYFVQIKFLVHYYLRSLFETGGSNYMSTTSFNEGLSKGNILERVYYYIGSTIVMQRRIIVYGGLNTLFLLPIFIGLLFTTFGKLTQIRPGSKFPTAKLVSFILFSTGVAILLLVFKNNYLGIQNIGQYVYAWPTNTYYDLFLFTDILFLFILNFRYSVIRLSLPVLPYYVMLIILTKNAPWARLWGVVILWIVILFSFLIDWMLTSSNKNYVVKRFRIGFLLLLIFIVFYTIPQTSSMAAQLFSGVTNTRNEITYLQWVDSVVPKNAVILGGGKSDLVTVAENIQRPIVFSTRWTGALLIKPKETPGIKASDFNILTQLKISKMPGTTPINDFSIIRELKNKNNFKRNKYIILDDDIYLWRARIAGIVDGVFSPSPESLHAGDYVIRVYKSNPVLNKNIYELKFNENGNS